MNRTTIVSQGRRVVMAACCALIGASALQSCKDDVLTGQPSYLGNSIYQRLQEDGNYNYTVRLIEDLDLAEVLNQTGSKTLFVADDKAYDAWFQNNDWNVSRYEDLNLSQKKLLLKNSMIDNAYLLELLGNTKGTPPSEGKAMRRKTSTHIYDSIQVLQPADMPNNPAWNALRARGKAVPVLKDETAAPMIHFLPSFMSYHNITAEDLSLLTNGHATSTQESWVNGKRVLPNYDENGNRVEGHDITCKNGYIHKVDGVIESSPNMAEIIRNLPEASIWSKILDRFSVPYRNVTATNDYQANKGKAAGADKDTVYNFRYLSNLSVGLKPVDTDEDKLIPSDEIGLLKFDPGWNQYIYRDDKDFDMHFDAGAMIVPTNAAMQNWWSPTGPGSDLYNEYGGDLDRVPLKTLAKLINVNMLTSFYESVPSNFQNVLNDAKESLGIKKEDIVKCYMGCNGVVYLVEPKDAAKPIFTPAEYASVVYPALAHSKTMNAIYWGIEELNFLPYLLAMDQHYSLLLPTNDAMKFYVDPYTYGLKEEATGTETPDIIEFYIDPKVAARSTQLKAWRWKSTIDADGRIVKNSSTDSIEVERDVIKKMMEDLVDQLIVVGDIESGYSYYKTKSGSIIKVNGSGSNLKVAGGWQVEHNTSIPVVNKYLKQNGKAYELEAQVPLGAEKSLVTVLNEHSEYKPFLNLLNSSYCDFLTQTLSNTYNCGGKDRGNQNFKLFDNYNYTVYVPGRKAIEDLQAAGKLPKWQELDETRIDSVSSPGEKIEISVIDSICTANDWFLEANAKTDADSTKVRTAVKNALTTIVDDFVRYHVHDHAIGIDMAPEDGVGPNYESMKRNPANGRFYPINATYSKSSLSVKDAKGKTHHVVTTPGLYNNIVREYWFQGNYTEKEQTARLFMGSNAMVHLLDDSGALMYADMKKWTVAVKEALIAAKVIK